MNVESTSEHADAFDPAGKPLEQAAAKRSGYRRIAAWVVVFSLIVGAPFLFVAATEIHKTNNSVGGFFQKVDSGDYSSLYEMAPTIQREGSAQEFVAYMKTIRETLGPVKRYSMRWCESNFEYRWGGTYVVTFERGSARVQFKFYGECGVEKLESFDLDSPELRTVLACPWCKEPFRSFRADCPRCHMPIHEQEPYSRSSLGGC